MAVLVHELHTSGVLREPDPPKPAMTVEDAARLLCRLSRSVKLSDPDDDYPRLLRSEAMVDYAWRQAVEAQIPAAERNDAEEARRLLIEHHHPSLRKTDGEQS